MGRKSWGLLCTVLTQSLLRCSVPFTSSRAPPLVHGNTKHKSCQLVDSIQNDVQLNFARCISIFLSFSCPVSFSLPLLLSSTRPKTEARKKADPSLGAGRHRRRTQASSCQKALLFLLPFFLLLCRCSISLMKRRRRNKMRKRVGRHMMGDNL